MPPLPSWNTLLSYTEFRPPPPLNNVLSEEPPMALVTCACRWYSSTHPVSLPRVLDGPPGLRPDARVPDRVMFEDIDIPIRGGVLAGSKAKNVMPQTAAILSFQSEETARLMRDMWDGGVLRPQHVGLFALDCLLWIASATCRCRCRRCNVFFFFHSFFFFLGPVDFQAFCAVGRERVSREAGVLGG